MICPVQVTSGIEDFKKLPLRRRGLPNHVSKERSLTIHTEQMRYDSPTTSCLRLWVGNWVSISTSSLSDIYPVHTEIQEGCISLDKHLTNKDIPEKFEDELMKWRHSPQEKAYQTRQGKAIPTLNTLLRLRYRRLPKLRLIRSVARLHRVRDRSSRWTRRGTSPGVYQQTPSSRKRDSSSCSSSPGQHKDDSPCPWKHTNRSRSSMKVYIPRTDRMKRIYR